MEKAKAIINHPLSKAVGCGVIGTFMLMEGHAFYSGTKQVVFLQFVVHESEPVVFP